MTTSQPPDLADLLVHASFVRGMARAVLRGDGLTDDIVQETWLAALKGGPRRPEAARPWLSGVVRNLAYGALRSEGRRTRRERAAARPVALPSTAEIAAKEETRRLLVKSVLGLREPYRATVLLRYYEDLPPRAVAARLGVPVETVRTRLKRALRELRTDLDQQHGGRREPWALGLLALAEPLAIAAPVATGTGLLLAWGAVAALLLAVVVAWMVWPTPAPDGDRGPRDDAGNPVPVLIGRARPMEMPPGKTAGRCLVRGRVRRGAGPCAARIEVRPRSGDSYLLIPASGKPMTSVNTDSAGAFELRDLRPGSYELRVLAEDGDPTIAFVLLHANGEHRRVEFLLAAATTTLHGIVRWRDGRPFEGFVLHGSASRGSTFVRTREDGRFVLRVTPSKRLRLSALAPDRIRVSARFDVASQPDETLEFVVDEGLVSFRGRAMSQPGGVPIPNAQISYLHTRAGNDGRSVRSWARSAEDGRFSILVFPGTAPTVEAVGHRQWRPPAAADDGGYALGRSARIEGRVVDVDGQPLGAGVCVQAVTLTEHDFDVPRRSETVTDAGGRFTLDATPGRVFLYAHGRGRASATIAGLKRKSFVADAFDAPSGSSLRRDLEVATCATLEGRVLDSDGEPIAGALLSVQVREPGLHRGVSGLQAYVATDSEGRFRCTDVVPGVRVRVVAFHPDFVKAESGEIALDPGMAGEVTLRLERPRAATVVVLDAVSGEPVVGAEVQLRASRVERWSFELGGPKGRTDAQGRVRIDGVPPGSCGVTVRRSGYVDDANPRRIDESAGGSDFEVTVRIEPEMAVQGRVFAPDGADLSKARVALIPTGETRFRGGYSPTGRSLGPDGTFRFAGKFKGTYRVKAWLHEEGARYAAQVDLTEGDDAIELHLTDALREGEWVVRVFDPQGRPMGAHVARILAPSGYVEWKDALAGVAAFEAYGTSVGEVYLLIVPGYWDEKAGPEPGSVLLGPLGDEGGRHEARLAAGRTLKGTVRYAGGSPAAGLGLRARPVLPLEKVQWQPHRSDLQARTDAEGRFTLTGLGEMAYRLAFEARPDGWKPKPVEVPADDDVPSIQLDDAPDTVALKIEDSAGRPAAGAYVAVHSVAPDARIVAQGTASGEGVVHLPGLDAEERYRLLAGRWRPTPAMYEVESWSPKESPIRLREGRLITGEVRDPEGRPLGPVRVYRRTGAGIWRMLQERTGSPWRGHVPPGRHLMKAVAADEAAPTPADTGGAWVEAGARDVQLVYDPGAMLRLRLVGWPPGESASVHLVEQGASDAEPRRSWFHRQPLIEFLHLDSSKAYVLWTTPDLLYAKKEHGLCVFLRDLRPDGRERTVQVLRAAPVHGSLQLPKGIDGQAVKLHANVAGIRVHGRVAKDGSFRIPGLPEGAWPLVFEIQRKSGIQRVEVESSAAEPMAVAVP